MTSRDDKNCEALRLTCSELADHFEKCMDGSSLHATLIERGIIAEALRAYAPSHARQSEDYFIVLNTLDAIRTADQRLGDQCVTAKLALGRLSSTPSAIAHIPPAVGENAKSGWVVDFKFIESVIEKAQDNYDSMSMEAVEGTICALIDMGFAKMRAADGGKATNG